TVGLVIDVTVFNVLRMTVLRPEDLAEGPVVAKIVSTSLAIAANWLGNRYWTFHREQRAHPVGEGLRFAIVSITAMAIPVTCLWLSHYVLGMTSLLADNVSTNVVGLALGMVFRFWLYRVWVFAVPADAGALGARTAGLETAAPEGGTSTSGHVPPAERSPAEVQWAEGSRAEGSRAEVAPSGAPVS